MSPLDLPDEPDVPVRVAAPPPCATACGECPVCHESFAATHINRLLFVRWLAQTGRISDWTEGSIATPLPPGSTPLDAWGSTVRQLGKEGGR